MCELFGLSANVKVGVKVSFEEFFEHSETHRHGWGIGFYTDNAAVIIKEAVIAKYSELLKFIKDHEYVKSNIVISHIRRRSAGEVAYRNTHPFCREVFGREWIFAHNGTARIRHNPQFRLEFYHPVGETDSEYAFCYILDRIRELGSEKQNDLTALHRVIEQAANEIGQHGKFNFLLSNGEYLFAYANRAFLYYLFRHPPHRGEIRLRSKEQTFLLSHLKMGHEKVALVATEELTDENWRPVPFNKLLVFKDGYLLSPSEELSDIEIKVLRFIRTSPHRVRIKKIATELNLPIEKVVEIIASLKSKNLIKQDSRDIENDIPWDSPDASYYTVPEKRDYIDRIIRQ